MPLDDQEIFIHDSTALASGEAAIKLFAALAERGHTIEQGLSLRFSHLTSLFKTKPFTWADHKRFHPTLRDYLQAGVSVSNLRGCHAAQTYLNLRDAFDFSPDDLVIDNKLFSVNHLRMFYGVDWKRLLIDFALGPEGYLDVLRLPLNNLVTLGLDFHTLHKWPYRDVFREFDKDLPGRDSEDRLRCRMRARLNRNLFMRCTHYKPTEWRDGLNMDYHTLAEDLELSGDDLWQMWGEKYYTSIEEIAEAFGYDPTSDEPFPFPRTARKHGKRRKHKKGHKHKRGHKHKNHRHESPKEEEHSPSPKQLGTTSSDEASSESSGIFSFFMPSSSSSRTETDAASSLSDSEELLARRRKQKKEKRKKKKKSKKKELSVL